jgi:hypothetical protein
LGADPGGAEPGLAGQFDLLDCVEASRLLCLSLM